MRLSSHTLSPAAPACPPPTLFLDVAPPPPSFSLFVSPPTIGRRYINISPFSALVVVVFFFLPPFPFSPRGCCLPLSAILSAACDQTGELQCASEGPAEGGGEPNSIQSCNATVLPTGRLPDQNTCSLRSRRTSVLSTSTSSNASAELILTLF